MYTIMRALRACAVVLEDTWARKSAKSRGREQVVVNEVEVEE